jgi:hypothetical protein
MQIFLAVACSIIAGLLLAWHGLLAPGLRARLGPVAFAGHVVFVHGIVFHIATYLYLGGFYRLLGIWTLGEDAFLF